MLFAQYQYGRPVSGHPVFLPSCVPANAAGDIEVLYQGTPLTIANRGEPDCEAGGSCPTVENVLAVDELGR